MKKNISINISGIIFHIEEDGYETLRKYLDSISKYFSSFEDSSEIMADIESRMAEIFLSKLNEGKQVITADDVNSLIATMGSVKDFKAAEDNGFESKENSSENQQNNEAEPSYVVPKQLLRDQKRKTLGGVCAGLGSYLNVDPLWIRLAFAFLTVFYGITIAVYIIMWIVVPGSYGLPEPEVNKKMFRDGDRKVLGGVAGGLASYLGIDIIAIRVLFIMFTIIGGLGVFLYIVLWLILPEAKTLTDKMQMQGEAVTLSNIESTIKKNQTLGNQEDETSFTKILLLPFRVLGTILRAMAKLLVPIVEVFRVGIGLFIMVLGLVLLLSLVVLAGILLGIFSGSLPAWLGLDHSEIGFPVEIFNGTFPALTTLAAFTVVIIPALFVVLLGISTIAKRIVFSSVIAWTLFVLFFVSIAVLGISVPRIIYAFKENGEYRIENTYQPNGKTVVLKMRQTGMDGYKVINLNLRGYEGKDFKLVQTFEAQGNTKLNAMDNARMMEYHVDFNDSIFTFDSNVQFKKDAKFRAQHLNLILYVPYDFPFVMTEDVSRFVSHYIEDENENGNTWKMTSKGLTCITCINPNKENHNTINTDLTDFNAVDVNGAFDLTITQGDHYTVELNGPESEKKNYDIYQRGETLVIDSKNDPAFFRKKDSNFNKIHITVTMPQLKQLEAKGAGKIYFNDFDSDNLEIEALGAMNISGKVHAKDLTITVSGASSLELEGNGITMEATIQGTSRLKAYNYEVTDASVKVHGVSHANVNVTEKLEMEEDFLSKIDYRGHPEIVKRN